MEQNEKGLMQWEKDFLISITILIIATIIAHIFFYQTAHNINVPMIYTLATFFISRYTKGYGWGIVSSLLSVIFINWRFTFPYFKINFMIDGYPMTDVYKRQILGRTPGDWDITTSASPQEVKEIFDHTVDTGIEHGTVTVLMNQDVYKRQLESCHGIFWNSFFSMKSSVCIVFYI